MSQDRIYDYAAERHDAELDALRHYDSRQLRYGANVPTETELAAETAEEKR